MSHFQHLSLMPPDPIMNLPILFAADPHPHKVNLGIGTYRNEQGRAALLASVQEAEKIILEKHLNKEYPPIEGEAAFIQPVFKLIFGDSAGLAERCFAQQTVGGTNALRVAGEFIYRNLNRKISLCNPTWANHHLIFQYANLAIDEYPYYSSQEHAVDFYKMCDHLKQLEKKSVVLLHGSCHNPTGMDLTQQQWQELSSLMKNQQLIPLFDLAYQGFGKGLDEDAYAVRLFAQEGHEMFVASSYAKNFGLYGERVGLLTTIVKDKETMEKVRSHLKQLARSNYSVPPLQGGRIVTTILQNAHLKQQWMLELEAMRNRIAKMRLALVAGLAEQGLKLEFLADQQGMFSYTDLNKEQVVRLKEEFGIYLAGSGRANIAGLNENNIDYVIEAISKVLK